MEPEMHTATLSCAVMRHCLVVSCCGGSKHPDMDPTHLKQNILLYCTFIYSKCRTTVFQVGNCWENTYIKTGGNNATPIISRVVV